MLWKQSVYSKNTHKRHSIAHRWAIGCLLLYMFWSMFQPSYNVTHKVVSSPNLVEMPLQWCHNGADCISYYQPHDCLLNFLFRHRSKKTSKLRENVSIWWRHHALGWRLPGHVIELSSPCAVSSITEMEKSSFWWNVHHWLHWKLSKWQLPVQPVMKISSKWRHFCFSDCLEGILDCLNSSPLVPHICVSE